jgi:hypothetical protein
MSQSIVGRHRPELHSMRFALKMYGLVTGNGHGGNGMLWAMDDHTVVVIQNDAGSPEGVRRTIYPVTEIRVSSLGLTASTDTGNISVVQAPCVCGAGPTATASPGTVDVGKKIDLQPMTEMPGWIHPAATL